MMSLGLPEFGSRGQVGGSASLVWRSVRVSGLAALAYVVLPIDLIPDSIPVLGRVDDVGLVAVALVRLVNDAGPDLVREHWDGDAETLEAFLSAVSLLDSLIPAPVRRLVALLDR